MPQLFLGARYHPCGIGLGSNLGNRIENLIRATKAILTLHGTRLSQLTRVAPIYESTPLDCPEGSGPFLNTVIEIETETGLHDLIDFLRQIEHEMGRPDERNRNAPRVIDLDILYCGESLINEPNLVVPHPRMHTRRFVLQPLADIRPDLKIRGQGKTVRELLDALDDNPAEITLFRRDWLNTPF